jgi:hypothetical protein
VDGHARQALDPEQVVPVLVLDLDQDEALKLMAVLDPLAAMAEANQEALDSLVAELETDSEALDALLRELSSGEADDLDKPTTLTPIDTKKPPAMTWALVGIPTVRFGEIAQHVESLAAIDGIFLETTSNDG